MAYGHGSTPQRRRATVAFLAVALFGTLTVAGRMAGLFESGPRHTPGVRNGRLAPCPERPNCVSSQTTSERHRIDPLPLTGGPEDAIGRLARVVQSMPRARVVARSANYLHAAFASRLLGFVDDVEFLVDEAEGVVHVRSASRLGYSDLGKNRERVEAIRAQLAVPEAGTR